VFLLAVFIVFSVVRSQHVLAAEFLRKATDAQQIARNAKREQRLVQVRIRKKVVLRRIGANTSPNALGEETSDQPEAAFVEKVLQSNHFDAQDPLSVTGFSAWRDSLKDRKDTITEDAGSLTLRTRSVQPVGEWGVSEARLTVKLSAYYPVNEVLVVGPNPLPETIEFTELGNALSSPQPAQAASLPAGTTANRVRALPPAHRVEPAGSVAVASLALEVQVRYQIHKLGADLGQEAAVTRTSQNQLLVSSVVEPDRKEQLLNALAPFQNNPVIHVSVRTTDEALRDSDASTGRSSKVVTLQEDGLNAVIPAGPVLLAYFDSEGIPRAEQATSVRQFSEEAVERSNTALLHALALQEWLQLFPPGTQSFHDQERQMWRSVIRDHLDAIVENTAALHSQLEPLYAGAKLVSRSNPLLPAEKSAVAMAMALAQCTKSQNEAIHAAFTVSNNGSQAVALKQPDFWRSLYQVQDLVQRLRLLTSDDK
jgi:hypothetical protein